MDTLKKTNEMVQYEEETGKQAIWQGKITKGFLKWKSGEMDYYANKKRISVYVSGDTEKKWEDFMKSHKISSFSKLIRESVNYYVKEKLSLGGKIISDLKQNNASDMGHIIKERLTNIKGFTQLIIENYGTELSDDIKSMINRVLNEIKQLEEKTVNTIEEKELTHPQYDILLVEDDTSTIELLRNYFERKGYSFKGVLTGVKAIEELKRATPRLILLDIILPDISGYDICLDIKSHKLLKEVPVFYLTAVPGSKVEEMMQQTMADGYILKPFDLPDLEFLFDYIKP